MNKKFYNGNEPCPGCGRPGTIATRHTKNSLCYECQDLLNLGRQVKAEGQRETEYTNLSIHLFACRNQKSNEAFLRFLTAINNEKAVAWGWVEINNPTYGNNERRFKIPKYLADAVKRLLEDLKAEFEETLYERNKIPGQIEEQLNKERNKIFNEGVAHGRNLLIQLNKGEIGIENFNAFVEKF